MREAVIVSTARTPIGRAYKGSLIGERPDDLAGFAIQKAMENVPDLDPAGIEDVMVGCGLTHAEASFTLPVRRACWRIARFRSWNNGERYCASSLQKIRMAYHGIAVGEGDAYVAAGVESTTELRGVGFDGAHLNPRFTDLLETISSTTPTSRWE